MIAACIDVGTSLIKTVAFDEKGKEVEVARTATEVLRPEPGFAEQDMDQVWDGIASTLREIGERNDQIELIALTAQGDGCWLVDAEGRPTGPAALWSDGRNPGIVERWEQDGTIEKAFRINGSLTFPGLPNAILNWMREHDPERVKRADKALYCGGWAFSKLTGELAVDESDASVPLLDIRAGAYSDELLDLYDLAWAKHLLPDVRRMDGRVGELSEGAAAATGLKAGLPVVMAPLRHRLDGDRLRRRRARPGVQHPRDDAVHRGHGGPRRHRGRADGLPHRHGRRGSLAAGLPDARGHRGADLGHGGTGRR